VSAKIGEKLLMGWTLLEPSCPRCNTPLMRDREKKTFCVSCNAMVVREDELDPNKYMIDNSKSIPSKQQEEQKNKIQPMFHPQEYEELQKFNSYEGEKGEEEEEEKERQYSTKPLHPVVKRARINVSREMNDTSSILDDTIAAIYIKMDETHKMLTRSSDIKYSKSICSLIIELAEAVKVVTEAKLTLSKK